MKINAAHSDHARPTEERVKKSSALAASMTLLLLAFACTASAQVFNTQTLDDYVTAQMQWEHIPGLSLAVVKDGKIILAKGYGLANVETRTPATPETVYKIGSVSKQFLAAGIMLLVQDGKLSLDDKASKYLEGTPDSWKEITVRHLLSHTSGIVRESPGFEPYKTQTDAEVIKATYALPLRFAPGEKWAYSNVNYYALAEIIHKVSGKPWSDFIAERIFAPAGMKATTTTTADIVLSRASGYDNKGGKLHNAEDWPAVRPSGAFISTVLDFAKWDAALYSDNILSAASREQMWKPVTLSNGETARYGLGWFTETFQGHRRIHHEGGIPGFSSDFERFVDDHLTVVVLTNANNRDLEDMALRVAGFYAPALVPAEKKAIPDAEPEVTAEIKKIIDGLANRQLDATLFTPERAATMNDQLKADFPEDIRRLGAILSVELLERKNESENRIYRYRISYRNMPLFVQCIFNKDGKIAKFAVGD
ncbi:MAG TPA: serine hydrolase domain-containing protein [Candidatus Angelobacter sp.]|nr:serine hydrolase domain-containing protein [Candidatus Angelobacter sp.]